MTPTLIASPRSMRGTTRMSAYSKTSVPGRGGAAPAGHVRITSGTSGARSSRYET